MSEPAEITETLKRIAHASAPTRQLARERVVEFKLEREKGEQPLPVVNVTTGSGAPLLDVDEVLRRSCPNHVGRK